VDVGSISADEVERSAWEGPSLITRRWGVLHTIVGIYTSAMNRSPADTTEEDRAPSPNIIYDGDGVTPDVSGHQVHLDMLLR
jgi:hypothetical protein